MFYEPDQAWLMVLPITHIVGRARVPLMKTYLEGLDSPTIPSSLARHNHVYFRHGHADRAGSSKGTGSRLFMLNVHLWQYGRPQPRTISIEERHANWQGRDKSLVKNESVGKTFCRTEVRVYALLCKLHHKVNIISTCSQHHESLPPLPYPPLPTPLT